MRALVVYESMFGNTAEVARGVAAGLERHGEVDLVDVGQASETIDEGIDLVVVGGPTHAFSMTRQRTRDEAVNQGASPEHAGRGIREWLAGLEAGPHTGAVATFDTKVDKMRRLPGSAAKGAARAAHGHGLDKVAPPESFYVEDTDGPLLEGELDRARAWGEQLGAEAVKGSTHPTS